MKDKTSKIDVHDYQKQYSATLDKLDKRTDVLDANKELIKQFCNDCLDGYTVIDKQKKKISVAGIRKYLFSLIVVGRSFEVPFDSIDSNNKKEPHIEQFIKDLECNKILSSTGKEYSAKTKRDIKVIFRKFMKWLFGDNINFPPCIQHIDTSYTYEEIPAISRDEVLFWANRELTLRRKALVVFLFDSGARAEELLNIRHKHLSYDKEEKSYKARIEFSKTKPRTVYLPIATEILRDYLGSLNPEEKHPDYQVFPFKYNYLRKLIVNGSKKFLEKHVTPHGLRHSSATYYCTKVTPYQLCYRYGWSMASDMPQRYIDREGLIDKQTASVVKVEMHDELKEDNRKLKEEMKFQRDQMSEMQKLLEALALKKQLES